MCGNARMMDTPPSATCFPARGRLPDRMTLSAPRDMRQRVRSAAAAAGVSSAAFIREAITDRLRSSTNKDSAHG